METAAPHEPHSSIGQVIRGQRERIVQRWQASVRRLSPMGGLPEPALRDDIAGVLDAVALAMESPVAQDAVWQEAPAAATEEHAVQRLGLGFELAHLLIEYSLLRSAILEVVSEQGQFDVHEFLRLNQAVDRIANQGIARFDQTSDRLFRALNQISSEAFGSSSLDQLLRRLLNVLVQASPTVDSVVILLVQADGRLHVRAAVGLVEERDREFSLAVGEGFSGTIAATNKPMFLASAHTDPLVRSQFIRDRGIRALYGVPLEDGQVIGVAHMGSCTAYDFTHEEKFLFQAMANRATAAIVQAQLREQEREARAAASREHSLLVSVLEQMPIGVGIAEAPSGRLLLGNESLERIWGRPMRWSKSIGDYGEWKGLHPGGGYYRPEEWPMTRSITEGVTVTREALEIERDDGTRRCLELSSAPVRDPSGQIVAGVAVTEDVTERKRLEGERELYLAMLSHDLRNPLGVIRLSADYLLRLGEARTPAMVKALGRIAVTSERMERLIQQLLDYGRSQHGRGIPIERARCNLPALCAQVIDGFHVTHPDRTIELEVRGGGTGRWDRDRLTQVVQNLIGNALEHGRADSPVRVRVGSVGADTILEVENDNARGAIPPQLLPHIFEAFRRSGEHGGVGLGLYICQEIARAHGSRIEVRSIGDTTNFSLRLAPE